MTITISMTALAIIKTIAIILSLVIGGAICRFLYWILLMATALRIPYLIALWFFAFLTVFVVYEIIVWR